MKLGHDCQDFSNMLYSNMFFSNIFSSTFFFKWFFWTGFHDSKLLEWQKIHKIRKNLRSVGDRKLRPRVKRSSRSKTFQCETTRWKLLRKVKLGETDELYCSTHDDMTTFKCQTLSYSWDHLTFSGLLVHCLMPVRWKFWTNQKTADLAENYSCVIGM